MSLSLFAGCARVEHVGPGAAAEVRLGFFPNVTHASALIARGKGFYAKELGGTRLTAQQFNAGPDEVTALLDGSLDAGFIGSGPAVTAFARSAGKGVRVVSGATSGGAQLVVKPGIAAPEQLRGRTIAVPQRGNTQDIALRKWLAGKGLAIGAGPNEVNVVTMDNPQTFDAFRSGRLDGGWLPEPWASRLVIDAGGRVLQDERALWPGGKFPTTVLLVRTQFLREHPATVEALLRAEQDAIEFAAADHDEAETVVNDQLRQLTGGELSRPVLDRALANIELTTDPLAVEFNQLAGDEVTAGVVRTTPDLTGFIDVEPLNRVRHERGKPPVDPG
ncbi:ABC transporter substrate-binding protein [Gandjariella thermophila]|uniref:ABC transporter substrate-binding protein n=1 Tax=Gandjariella thermophila TaxID=1931992 RepID=UPI001CEF9003|nr:ABC transporter substrate-binding protein [Gandjariella thermophila]